MPDIRNVVVLMLENRSFDCMLGRLYPASATYDGLTGSEQNFWHDGAEQVAVPVWTGLADEAAEFTTPDPDPGELFTDIQQQIYGSPNFKGAMSGFADNYMSHAAAGENRVAQAVMHYFTPEQLPVISELARAYGVSDCWFASAPCQTWPNRLFAHTGSAGGDVNNTATHVPYMMETTFDRVAAGGKGWGIFFHDFPQTATLGRLWPHPGGFHDFADFLTAAAAGTLPAYSFIEPRFYPDPITGKPPNDQHPPHNVIEGEILIADVYNALRAGPNWQHTLLIITYDEHGGCFDHVPPGPAVPPGGPAPDGFVFNSFGVRVPAVIVSPYVAPGSIIRPAGKTPFDHTSIFKTLQEVFGLDATPLTPRSAAAPSLVPAFTANPDNNGPPQIVPPEPPVAQSAAALAAAPPNHMQQGLAQAAEQLPTIGANTDQHIQRLAVTQPLLTVHDTAADAAAAAAAHLKAFLGW